MTFRQWLGKVGQPGAMKSFALEWIFDRSRPRAVKSLSEIVDHLTARGASEAIIAGARQAWAAWADDCAATDGLIICDELVGPSMGLRMRAIGEHDLAFLTVPGGASAWSPCRRPNLTPPAPRVPRFGIVDEARAHAAIAASMVARRVRRAR